MDTEINIEKLTKDYEATHKRNFMYPLYLYMYYCLMNEDYIEDILDEWKENGEQDLLDNYILFEDLEPSDKERAIRILMDSFMSCDNSYQFSVSAEAHAFNRWLARQGSQAVTKLRTMLKHKIARIIHTDTFYDMGW